MTQKEILKRLAAIQGWLSHDEKSVETVNNELNNLIEDITLEGLEAEPVCPRCKILIRPEGGHLCGDCGRNI